MKVECSSTGRKIKENIKTLIDIIYNNVEFIDYDCFYLIVYAYNITYYCYNCIDVKLTNNYYYGFRFWL